MDPRPKIEQQFDMTGGKKQLSLTKRRVGVNENSYNLIIGLGGTGCQALIETKGLIQLTCEDSERNVAYLAFDTDDGALRDLCSSDATGGVHLDEGERQLLLSDDLGSIFAPATIGTSFRQNPEFFEWVDTRLTPNNANTGAGGIRQLGRLILQKNYNRVQTAIKKAATRLSANGAGGAGHAYLNVYILAGVSGGTGSGSFIDMPYIVRQTLKSTTGFVANMHKIYGYLFMPDVNANHGGDADVLQRNAYAAFQELDFNIDIQDLNQRFSIRYSGAPSVEPGAGASVIYDYVHLVSATDANGHILADAYNVAIRAIAQNILSFVANEVAVDHNGINAFAIQSHYDNINGKIANYINSHRTLAHRCQKYLAIGSTSFDLPIDDIMMYITSLLFEQMRAMYENEPTAEAFNYINDKIGIRVDNILAAFQGYVPQLCVPNVSRDMYNNRGKVPIVDYQARANSIYLAAVNDANFQNTLNNAVMKITNDIKKRFDEEMEGCFRDENRGPVYANQLIVRNGVGIISTIIEQRGLVNYVDGNPAMLFANDCNNFATAKANLKGTRIDEKLSAYNKTGKTLFNNFSRYALREGIKAIYREVLDYITQKNSQLYAFVTAVLQSLEAVFRRDGEILTAGNERVIDGNRHFNWEVISIPQIQGILKENFDAVFQDNNRNLIKDFVNDLWNQALVWMEDDNQYDPRAFVSAYIDKQFGDVAALTIEDIVLQLLAPGQTLQAACEQLCDKLTAESAPLFYPRQGAAAAGGGPSVMLISIPSQCNNIFTAVQNILGARPDIIIQKSNINTRIYAQTVQCGIALADYQEIWNAELEYAEQASAVGLHLIDPNGKYAPTDCVSWRTMCTLIPNYLRPVGAATPMLQRLIDKEDEHKQMILDQIDAAEMTSKHPAIALTRDLNSLEMVLHITNIDVDVQGATLRLMRGRDCIATFDYQTDETPIAAQTKLNGILRDGLGSEPGADVTEYLIKQEFDAHTSAKDILETLTEQYIRAIYLVHDFELELKKYEAIRAYLQSINAFINAKQVIRERVANFAQLRLLERVERYEDLNGHWMAALVKKDGSDWPFAVMRETVDYMLDYELFMYFYRCLDGEKISKDEAISPERIEKRQRACKNIVEGVLSAFRDAVTRREPICQEYLAKAQAMLQEADRMRDKPAIQNTREGFEQSVPSEVVQFYEDWRNGVAGLVRTLEHACRQRGGAAAPIATGPAGGDAFDPDDF